MARVPLDRIVAVNIGCERFSIVFNYISPMLSCITLLRLLFLGYIRCIIINYCSCIIATII